MLAAELPGASAADALHSEQQPAAEEENGGGEQEEDEEEDSEEEDDAEDELRRAARAGILLLEKNTELQHENAALRLQVRALESERPRLAEELAQRASELELLREERRQSLLEITRLQGEQRATSQLVTSSLDREQRLKQQKEAADAALAAAEDKMRALRQEMVERSLVAGGADTFSATADVSSGYAKRSEITVSNPAATYDSNQRSAFTLAEHEELLAKWQRTASENESLLMEMKSLKKDLDAHKRRAAKLNELAPRLERVEKKAAKLQLTNDGLTEELTEVRAVNESQRTMIAVYKKIADARPFSTDCTCALHPEDALGVSVQEQLLENNMRLEKELREMRARLALTASMVKEEEDGERAEEEEYAPTVDDSTDNNSTNNNSGEQDVDEMFRVSETETTLHGLETVASNADVDFLIKRIQDLEEKQAALKDSLRHAKHQWQAAIASQKALEECNRAAQAEITRLTQQVDHKVSGLSTTQRQGRGDSTALGDDEVVDEHGDEGDDDGTKRAPDGTFEDADDGEKWTEEVAPYPAPPGDLNSPLIKCLLDHWTTDKSKIMHLTDWLHHAIRGTGKPRPLRLEHLTSEVAAGFTQLLVPILRERHGVSVKIYRRESIQILTDMVFQAHQPTQPPETPSIFSTIAAAFSGVMAPSSASSSSASPLFAEEIRARVERSNSSGSAASSESGSASGARARRRRQENPFVMSEAHFLYG